MEYPIDTVKQPQDPSSNSPLDAIRGARDGICSLYKQTPNWFTRSAGLVHPIVRDTIGAMDNLCSDKPLPLPAQKPLNGGQCATNYVVTFRVTNPKTGISSTFSRTLYGKLGGMTKRQLAVDTDGVSIFRYGFISNINESFPEGVDNDLSNGRADQFVVTLEGIARSDGKSDNCGDPFPVDPPGDLGTSITVNVNLPNIRVSPTANIVVPVVVLAPKIVFSPNGTASFNMPINVGGQRFNFDGSSISLEKTVNIDSTSINTAITNSQTAINNNTNTAITNSQTAINNNTNTKISSSQSSLSTAITNSQTAINSNTNTAITNSQTAINSNTNTAITSAVTNITGSVNSGFLALTAKVDAIALVLGVINANVSLALQILGRLELRPECPPELLPPGSPDVDDVVKPETPKSGNNPKIQAVTIVLTVLPVKAQWGGGQGAPDKQIAGWFAWKVDGYGYLAQQNINYQQSTFIRPANVSGYAYTLTNSARGFAIEHTLK